MKTRAGLSSTAKVLQDALNRRFKNIAKPDGENGEGRVKNVYVAATFLDLRYRDQLDEHQVKAATSFLSSSAHLLDYLQVTTKKAAMVKTHQVSKRKAATWLKMIVII